MLPETLARFLRPALPFTLGLALSGCSAEPVEPVAAAPETADAFIARINAEMAELDVETRAALWVRATYLTSDTALLATRARERQMAFMLRATEQAKEFEGRATSPDAARSIHLLRLRGSNPAPADPAARAELARILTEMPGFYGAARYCPQGEVSCLPLQALEEILATSRQPEELLDVWQGWRSLFPASRDAYARFVELANRGARERGFDDLGTMWKSRYEMSPVAFEARSAALWERVAPLYEALHCYVRRRLAGHYGEDVVPLDRPIPAHLLGNMWAQEWGHIFDLVVPYENAAALDVDAALTAGGYDAVRMTKTAEGFFTSIGLPALPETFWQRSLLRKPRDREVICHASAWPLDGGNDVRIKQCVEISEEHLNTLHHELGHIFYFMQYRHLPPLYQSGAHDGFHEGIGDTIQLSMTPGYLAKIGLADPAEDSREATINRLMKLALDKVAFLPFGKLIDEWRWSVFSGEIGPEDYNTAWWKLRTRYQGIEPGIPRAEASFDPGAKYHVPANVPYARYFLARILQFQFHRALCQAAGDTGPLHACSIFGNQKAGQKLADMMALGASRPWPEALEKITGNREMDASAILDYFAPLREWLDEENAGSTCGW